MKKIYLLIKIGLIALLLSACGEGGGDASFKSNIEKIAIAECNTISPVYTTIQKGDILPKNDSIQVEIVYNSNNEIEICTLSGIVYLLRDK
jgi:hypothetical protein